MYGTWERTNEWRARLGDRHRVFSENGKPEIAYITLRFTGGRGRLRIDADNRKLQDDAGGWS
jgi:hypothetical protein